MIPIPAFRLNSRRLFAAIVPSLVLATLAVAFSGSEFGSLTGSIYHSVDKGADVLLASLIISAWLPRSAALLCAIGAALCLPTYSYGWAPGIYRWLFPGSYVYYTDNTFEFAPFGIVGTVALLWMLWIAWSTVRRGPKFEDGFPPEALPESVPGRFV